MAVTNLGDQAVTRTDTSDPYNMAITVPANCRGIAVGLSHGTSSTDHVVSVVFDGVTFTRIIRATDTVTEPGDAILYFGAKLGGTFTSGAGTLVIQLATGTTDDIHINVWYIGSDASSDLEVIDSDSISNNAANPTVTLSKSGRSGLCVCQMYGGAAAPGGTLATGNTLDGSVDHTAFYSQACHETTIDTADHTIGWSSLTSDDLAFVALCVAEKVPAAIDAQPGSYSLTGAVAGVPAGRVVSSDPGSYALSGVTASLVAGRAVEAVPGAYALTGADAAIVAGRVLSVDSGSYALTGFVADLVLTTAAAYEIDAVPGNYALSGLAASVVAGRTVVTDPASYLLDGVVTGLTADLVFSAEPGSYAVMGAPASIVTGRIISTDAGAYVVSGQLVELLRGLSLTGDPGSYVLAGDMAMLAADFIFDAAPGTYVLTGSEASMVVGHFLSVDPGTYTLIGDPTALLSEHALAGTPGVYVVDGFPANLFIPGIYVLDADIGIYLLSGADAGGGVVALPPFQPASHGGSATGDRRGQVFDEDAEEELLLVLLGEL